MGLQRLTRQSVHSLSPLPTRLSGYPNVGKSSIINSLKRSRVCGVGATPGFTKASQEIVLDKHVHLLDSPGGWWAERRSATRRHHACC